MLELLDGVGDELDDRESVTLAEEDMVTLADRVIESDPVDVNVMDDEGVRVDVLVGVTEDDELEV